ncbi:MAG: flippase-like domain-containing protein [Chloroflexota bacterium]|nr:MAG: flippase-like domain-containing protein [Chloroflexota bacterium]
MKSKIQLILKALISLALIAYLLSQTEFSAIFASLISADPRYLLLAMLTLFLGKLISGYRWQILLLAQDIKIPLKTLIASLFVGQFFNSFLPTTIGGDAIRAYDTAIESEESAKAVTTVFMDRFVGVLALVTLAVLAVPIAMLVGEDVSFYFIPVLIVFLLCVVGLVVVLNNSLVRIFANFLLKMRLSRIANLVMKIYQSIQEMKGDATALWLAFGISILLQINVVIFHYLIALSIDLDFSIIYFFILVPIVLTVLIVPFSINGIGLREGAFVFLLAGIGVTAYDAIAFSLLSFFLVLTQAVIGGIIFALRGVKISDLTTSQTS